MTGLPRQSKLTAWTKEREAMEQDAFMNCTEVHPQKDLSLDFCGLEHCKSGHRYGPLARGHYILHIVLEGKGQLTYRQRTWDIGANTLFLIPEGEETMYVADETDPWYYCWVGFKGSRAAEILRNIGFHQENVVLRVKDAKKLEEKVRQLIDYPEMNLEDGLMRKGILLQLLSMMMKDTEKDSDRTALSDTDASYGEYAIAYLRNHFREKVRISELAEKIGISRSYLMRIFKEETGVSPQEFLIRLRMNYGMHYLTHSNMEITDIARFCGYEDALAFSKAFKNRFGMSPTQYRQM